MKALLSLIWLFALAACGGDGTPSANPVLAPPLTAVATLTPTPTQTATAVRTRTGAPTPTVTNRIRYHLVETPDPWRVEGSRLSFSETFSIQPILLSLAGAFEVIPVEPLPPNTTVALRIVNVAFTAGPFVIEGDGDVGRISVTTLDPALPLSAVVRVTVTQQFTHEVFEVELTGTGAADTFTSDFPPALKGVTVSSYGDLFSHSVSLDIIAAPEAGESLP